MLKIDSLTFMLIINLIPNCVCDCGQPGSSQKAVASIDFIPKSNWSEEYPEGHIIKYTCVSNNDNDTFLFGSKLRRCQNGQWTGSVPKCGKNYSGNVAVNQTDNGFHFSISQSEKIVGISLTISSLEALNLDSFSVSNLMLAHCSLRRFSQNESQIVCSTSIVDLKKLPRVSWISIQFFDQFCIKNDSNCFQLMEFKLYQVGNDPDSCVILDTPPYGKIDKNPSSLNFEVKCKNGFIMDSNSLFIISCQSDEDEIRKVYASAKCHPENVCPLEETLSYIYAEYDYLWNWTHANVNCSVKYNCPDGHYLRGTSFRNCLKNGKWSGSQPLCIKKNQCKIIDMLYPTVSFVFGIIITIILFSLFKHLFINKYHVRK